MIDSPYRDALMMVKCRGHAEDFGEEFLAAFMCKESGQRTQAANLRQGVRVKLERMPMSEAPLGLKNLATADDILNFDLPVYWVKSFSSAEPLPDRSANPGRTQFANRPLNSVIKSRLDVPTGPSSAPMYFYGGDWELYSAGAERKLISRDRGGVRSAVRGLSEKLAALGITLVFVPAPQSASLYPDVAMGSNDGRECKGRRSGESVGMLLEALRQDGVKVVDLYQHFSLHRFYVHEGREYPAWLNSDTHWSSWAAAEAAGQIAKTIRSVVELPEAKILPHALPVTWKPIEYDGDIRRMDLVTALGVQIPLCPTVTLQVSAVTPEAEALLKRDDLTAQVHLMGDSFVQTWEELQAGFATHLARELGLPVRTVWSMEGAQLGAPRQWVQTSKGLRPKVLVWLVAERALTSSNWQGGELIQPGQ
ncbi:hypothetical protein [Verrucomicrobium sp. BvORR034]|uniref:alginate O-acetyltransferase AlgX-related protein n=1 Tax=Verrucomicrobium sp. BvORR034 TaxID=1396418 RepID=UPI002240F4E8|nr:hypothetical protein [Verrucomicrobium sp. BvORR034]